MEKVCCGGGEGEQLPSKKKRGRPRKSEQEAARITKEKKDGSVKDKKEIRHRSTEDNASKLMEYTASNQLFIKGNKMQKEGQGEAVMEKTTHMKQAVGDPVDGVIDGAFDAGYLVTIKIGSHSDRLYHGVVFGPELSTPVNQQNDVVPQLKMMTYASQGTSGYGYGVV